MLELPPHAWLTTAVYARHRQALGAADEALHELVVIRELRRDEWAYLIRLATARPRVRLAERLRALARGLLDLPARRSRQKESRARGRTSIPGDPVEPDGTPRSHYALPARTAEGDGL
ncbi:MAG: hypothetical protein AB1609_22915 [Bacillota bacterium]